MDSSSQDTTSAPDPSLSWAGRVRCFLAIVCSHLAAPYAVARLIIRYQLQGDFETIYIVIAGVSILAGAALAWRQMLNLSVSHKLRYILFGMVLWLVVAFVLLGIAAHSDISSALLGTMWAAGTLWIAWTVWAYSFFRSRGVLIGSLLVGLVAVPFWVLVEATGLRGDTRVEFAWRRPLDPGLAASESSRIDSTGGILWGGFLGPNRNAVLSDIQLNEDWAGHPPEQLWLKSCGTGWSSFAVTETTIFGQEQLATGDCVTARDLETGEILWATPQVTEGFRSGLGGNGPRATPTLHMLDLDGSPQLVVFAVGATGLLSCLDANSGETRWTSDLREQFPGEELIHGVCGSPQVVDNLVVVATPADSGPCVVAFNLQDGQLAWTCDSDWRASYTSPALMTICDRAQIIFYAGPGVLSVDPADGSVLWQHEWANEFGSNATQPLQVEGSPNDLLIATGYQGGATRITVSADDEGQLSTKEVWNTRRLMKTKFCNIAQFGDTLVGLDNGILCGVNVETGKRAWKKGRYGHGQMLRAGNHLLIVEEKGDIRILKPNAEGPHPIGDSIQALDRKTWSHPVMVDDRLILRNDQNIVCLRIPIVGPAAE